jgi:hypothetical protein
LGETCVYSKSGDALRVIRKIITFEACTIHYQSWKGS